MAGVPVGDTTLLEGIARVLLGVGAEQAKMELASGEIMGTPAGDAFAAVVALVEAAQRLKESEGFADEESEEAWAALSAALAPFVGEATQRGSSETPAPVTTRDIVGLVPDIAGDLSAVEHVRQLRATESDNE